LARITAFTTRLNPIKQSFSHGGLSIVTCRIYFRLSYHVLLPYHLALSAQYAALILPLAILRPCLDLNDLRFAFILSLSPAFGLPAVEAPCSPKRMVFT
jgi:hypothetical protein